MILGLGALASSHVEPGSPYYRKIRLSAVDACNQGWASKAQDALADPPQEKTEVVRAIGFSILDSVVNSYDRKVLPAFIAEMNAGGNKLDDAIGKIMNLSRQDVLAGSAGYVMSHYGR